MWKRSALFGWKFALLIAFSGFILFVVSLAVAIMLSDTTGDRWIPVFRIGQLVGQIALLVGILGILIDCVTRLIRF